MTDIFYSVKPNDISLALNGHAGDTRVCAGVSTLAYTLYNRMVDIGCDVLVGDSLDGIMTLRVYFTDEQEKTVTTTFEAILTGFRLLEEFHPDNVVVRTN